MICIINKPLLYHDLYQKKPDYHHNSKYTPNSWTSSVESAQYMGHKLQTCLYLNRRISQKPYRWFLTIYFHRLMTPETISEQWTEICGRLRRNGLIAFWIREFTIKSKVHYHLLIVNDISQKELERIVEKSVTRNPNTGTWHKQVKPINKDWNLLAYIAKSKVSGFVKGKYTVDKYAKKTTSLSSQFGTSQAWKDRRFLDKTLVGYMENGSKARSQNRQRTIRQKSFRIWSEIL